MSHSKTIEDYYNINQVYYDLYWSKDFLHYGFWEADTKTNKEALLNTVKFVADKINIQSEDVCLDAGCGVGGVSIYFGKTIGAKCEGVTLSEVQIQKARKKIAKEGLGQNVNCTKQNYTDTNFPNAFFTKLFGIESICYAERKIDFLREAYRVLKTQGQIAVADAFLVRLPQGAEELKIYHRFIKGWALPNLALQQNFHKEMEEVGFGDVQFYDKLGQTYKCTQRIFLLSLIGLPMTFLLSNLGIIPKSMHQHMIASYYQKKLVKRGLVTYGVFTARKP